MRAADTQPERGSCQSREAPMASLVLCVPIGAPVWSASGKKTCIALAGYLKKLKNVYIR